MASQQSLIQRDAMRIIRGKYQRRQIKAPANLPVRPTTDMAKESLFILIDNQLDLNEIAAALDLFGGTGNISYELASRGCKSVTTIEQDGQCVRFIQKTAAELHMENLQVIRSDVFRFIPLTRKKFDFIFADPPYDSPHYELLLRLIFEHELLLPDGLLVIEHHQAIDYSTHERFVNMKRYGRVHFSFFR